MASNKGHTFDVDRAIDLLRKGWGEYGYGHDMIPDCGWSFADIGHLFGVSRQAVHKRHKAYLSSSKGGGRRRPKATSAR